MSVPAKATVLALASCLVLGTMGILLLTHVYDTWSAGEMWLKPRSAPRRLVTYASRPSEFVLRLVFVGSGAVVFLSGAMAGVIGLVEKAVVLRKRQLPAGRFRSAVAAPFAALALGAFCLWFALLFYLPFAYA
jgi:hypothetical protein